MKNVFSKGEQGGPKKATASDLLRRAPKELTLNTLASVIDSGAAIIIASTRNGDALVLTLLDGDSKDKVYISDVEELRTALTDLAAAYVPGT